MRYERHRDPACDVGEIVRDPERLAEVRRTGLLDSPPEQSFDRLTRLAARLVSAPVAFISLVDAARDFYMSAQGFDEPLASSRELGGLTFCHYAVSGSDPLIIPDTRAHPIYSQVPTVETLGVAAYVGIPLVTSAGYAVGSFCVIDFEPREWRDLDVELLTELAASTLREIELRFALREAEAARHRAEAASHARDEIVGLLSYDLRNPVHTVRSSASMLLEQDTLSDDERRRFLAIIHRNADAMARLLADLLDVAAIEAGGFRIDAAVVDSAALLEEAVDRLTPAAASRGLALRVEAPAELPPVLADRARIQQVFARLVGNAIGSTPAGGEVVVRATRREDDVLFAVTDAGRGIPSEYLSRTFDRFWRAAEPTRGARLGLAIVHGIVRAHGGAVGVASAPGAGSTFSFTIPSASSMRNADTPPSPTAGED